MAEASEAASAPQEEPGPLWQAFSVLLDGCACLGRTTVAGGKGVYHGVQRASYPVKEVVVSTVDSTSYYFSPYQKRQPAGAHIPSFRGN
mmetsp:Transcript_108448/g.188244  ORF Transcript_108448/g.188244 Transcript_108448/m.188244 type:complete len:89 (-) Transcript_108448:143-409(-)